MSEVGKPIIIGKVNGIGNVIGEGSSSHVQIVFSLINRFEPEQRRLEYNPRHDTVSPLSFARHPDAVLPELDHLIGHKAELERLARLYARAQEEGKGAFVFLTGRSGYGAKALGRQFVDFVRRAKGCALITRFWEADNERHTRRDPRWRAGFEDYAEAFEYAPDFLKTPEVFPFWGLFWQLCSQRSEAVSLPLPASESEMPAFLRDLIALARPLREKIESCGTKE